MVARKLRLLIWERDDGICQLCQAPVPFDRYMHADHVEAASLGGPTTVQNLRATHHVCNIRRGNGLPRARSKQNVVCIVVRPQPSLEAEIRRLTEEEDRPLNRTIIRLLRAGLEHYRAEAAGSADQEGD
jgi:hypothetical protein